MTVPTPHAAALAEIPIREDAVEVLGSTTRYWEYGPKDARHTLVIAHGYRGDHHGLEPVIALLPDVHIISPDLPGFGVSSAMTEAPHTIAGYGLWLNAFLSALGVRGQAIIVGHSFGSMVTSHAVADGLPTPGLILINPISTDPERGAGKFITALTRAFYGLARRLPQGMGRALLGNWLIVQFMSQSIATTPDPVLRKWIHEEHHRYFNGFSDPITVADAFDASLSTEVGKAASRITVPTVMIAGDIDRITPVDGQYATVALFPAEAQAELVVLPKVGHLIHYEAAEGAASAIRAFLARLP
ncbi:MAG TPA: alpha/beta hydrolase [Pseudolysinimonas sp.]|nr:alpha/beta hydrolase [Pseudolysinimonas sp.]